MTWMSNDASCAWAANTLQEEIRRLEWDAARLRKRPRVPGAGEFLAAAYEAAAHELKKQLFFVDRRTDPTEKWGRS